MWKLIKLFFWVWRSKQLKEACEYSITKTAKDISFSYADNDMVKQAESHQWAKLYMKEYGGEASDSEINLMIEILFQLKRGNKNGNCNFETKSTSIRKSICST